MKRTVLLSIVTITLLVFGAARAHADSASDRAAIAASLNQLAGTAHSLGRTAQNSSDRGVRKKFAPVANDLGDDLVTLARRASKLDVSLDNIVRGFGELDKDANRLVEAADEAEDKAERKNLRSQAVQLAQTITAARRIVEAYAAKKEEAARAPKGPTAMTDAAFAVLHNSVRRGTFDKDKAGLIADAAAYNWFTSKQLAQLIGTMSFDQTKVDAAVSAWNKLVDPQNSSVIYGKLNFSSSRDDLRKRVGR